jgi:ribose transport system substrate-binding protein
MHKQLARTVARVGMMAITLCACAHQHTAGAEQAADDFTGVTKPIALAPFNPNNPSCHAPPGLSRSLAFVQDNTREFMQGVAFGLGLAAEDRGLSFDIYLANNDPALMSRHVENLVDHKAGAAVVAPIDAEGLAPHLIRFMRQGGYIGAIVPPPATSILNAPQYKTGQVLAEAAAAYAENSFTEKANVVLLTHDTNQFLAPRFAAMRDILSANPNINIIADISPQTVDKQGGYDTMKIVLLANPRIDVVLGADTVVLGALKALREAGKDRPDQFLGGIDGEPEAVAEIKTGNSPYKATISLNSPVFSYAMGQHAADWLEGKSIPQAMDVLPIALSGGTITQFEKDMADPRSVYLDVARRNQYLQMYGNICFDTRSEFLNFPWSSER